MTRKEFLNILRKKLSFLSKEELEEEILYYINQIDSSKEDDSKIIKGFGSFEEIAMKAAEKYNREYKKDTVFQRIEDFYEELGNLGKYVKDCDNKERTKIIKDMVLLILVTILLKLPFILVRDLGDNFIDMAINSNIIVLALWGLVIEIIYVVCALYFFVKTLRKWIKSLI